MKMKIGIIGCGFIGGKLAERVKSMEKCELVAVNDIEKEKAQKIIDSYEGVEFLEINDLVKRCDLVIEAAHPEIVIDLVKRCICEKKDVMIMSCGGLVENLRLLEEAKNSGVKVHVPSGSIGGLDVVRAARCGEIESAELVTTKPASSLGDVREKKVLFDDGVKEAVKKFPRNINVAAALAIAVGDIDKVNVKIVCDPSVDKNIHEIVVKGDFGVMNFKIENVQSENPRTSYLALLSAISCLEEISLSC